MRNSLNAYLCGLALSDGVVCASSVLIYWGKTVADCSAWAITLYTRIVPILFPVSRIAQAFSIYVTVFAAIDVACATLLPSRWR